MKTLRVHDIESNSYHEYVEFRRTDSGVDERVVMKSPQYGHTSNTLDKVEILYDEFFEEFEKLSLECDGLTKILSYLLTQANIKHYVHTGALNGPNEVIWHQWIELFDGNYLDYRARMWQGETAPHGVFDPELIEIVQYTSKTKEIWDVPKIYFDILTQKIMVTNKQKYPILNTDETDPEVWWNNLTRWDHVAVGGISVHFGMMTSKYKWQCDVPYSALKGRKQKKMVDYILKQKDAEWKMFPVSVKI